MTGIVRRVLVADDQVDVLEALRLFLKGEGFAIVTAGSPAATLRAADEEEFDAALIDLNFTRDTTSGSEGLDLLARLRAVDPMLPVVVMTAWGTIEGAVEAVRRGARDYLQKPWDNHRLVTLLRNQSDLARALRKSRRWEQAAAHGVESGSVAPVAESRAMREVLTLLERTAPSDANILLTGEHGTGKEVVARWIHALSPRCEGPFVAINAGGLSDGVLESELFGHVRGAFTDAKSDRAGCFELADGGTLFLDEIGNMPTGQQAKLLRALQTGEFRAVGSTKVRYASARVVSATNADVAREIREGRFREDLLYRLNTVEVHLPALRDRQEDIAPLAAHFLASMVVRYRKPIRGFAPGAAQALLSHSWPGNVRELEHVVERAVLLASRDEILESDLMLRASAIPDTAIEELTLEEVERHFVERALARAEGNVSTAAKKLGLSRSALYRRLVYFGLSAKG